MMLRPAPFVECDLPDVAEAGLVLRRGLDFGVIIILEKALEPQKNA